MLFNIIKLAFSTPASRKRMVIAVILATIATGVIVSAPPKEGAKDQTIRLFDVAVNTPMAIKNNQIYLESEHKIYRIRKSAELRNSPATQDSLFIVKLSDDDVLLCWPKGAHRNDVMSGRPMASVKPRSSKAECRKWRSGLPPGDDG